tara:strand:+ start:44239 stop:44799 length:561 start_codon:yes stop_codon:yes gene_type:complete
MEKFDKILIASFTDEDCASETIRDLRKSGLSDKQVGLLAKDDDNKTRFKSLKELDGEGDNQVGSGAATGAAIGAGGGALWALGIAAGLVPAIGPVVGGGILAALASAGTGAVGGGLLGSLVGLGMSNDEANFVTAELAAGNTVVMVKNPKHPEDTRAILQRHRALFAPAPRRVEEVHVRESNRETI